jgi:ABC-type transporter Mla MlaB component
MSAFITRKNVGIFSFFGKKDSPQVSAPDDKNPSRKKRTEGAGRIAASSEAGRAQTVQRTVARATAMKIDAIESEMSSEFVNTLSANRPAASAATQPKVAAGPPAKSQAASPQEAKARTPAAFQPTLPLGNTTDFLLSAGTTVGNVAASAGETAPVIEEAAILYANGQIDMVEQVLRDAIRDDTLGSDALTVWRMLFELYQLTGKRPQFDTLSIDYASKFETSPPAWIETAVEQPVAPVAARKSVPTVPFSGRLDGSIVKLLERAKKLAELSKVLRLEYIHVTEVDPIGCGILLSVLNKLQKSGHDLILVGALELVTKVRAILEVGRRDETEAPWLLLMEILRLLNLEKDFEEASIDYCVTFEVSPPAFVAPKNKVTTALEENVPPEPTSEHFMMPTIVEGRTDQLLQAIAEYAAEHNPAIIDCSRLTRVEFSATAQLLSGLAPLTGGDNVIELHCVNQLVAALFNVMGLKDIVRILPRKI